MNAGNALFIDVIPDCSGSLLVNAGADLLVATFDVRRLFLDPCGVFPQNFSQRPGNFGNVRLGLLQLMGVKVHILHADGGRQNIHIPVEDVPPVGGHRRRAGLVAQSEGGIIIVVRHHQAVQPQPNRQEGQRPQQRGYQHDAPVLAAVQPQTVKFPLLPPHKPPAFPSRYNFGQQGNPSPPSAAAILLYEEGRTLCRERHTFAAQPKEADSPSPNRPPKNQTMSSQSVRSGFGWEIVTVMVLLGTSSTGTMPSASALSRMSSRS